MYANSSCFHFRKGTLRLSSSPSKVRGSKRQSQRGLPAFRLSPLPLSPLTALRVSPQSDSESQDGRNLICCQVKAASQGAGAARKKGSHSSDDHFQRAVALRPGEQGKQATGWG